MAKLPKATKEALARRAVSAANAMEYWAQRLEDEIKVENPGVWEKTRNTDDLRPVTVKFSTVQRVIIDMLSRAKDIRQLSDKGEI
jgi:hypothetical protein